MLMYPTDMSPWPPKPADTTGKYPCKASAGNPTRYDNCTDLNTIPHQQKRFCKGCRCPWRVCVACSSQHAAAPDIREIDPETGLCRWHTEFGTEAIRPSEEIPEIRRRSISAIKHIDAKPTDDDNDEKYDGASAEFDVELVTHYSLIAHERFHGRRRLIMRYLEQSVSRTEIAKRIRTQPGTLGTTILDMGRILKVDLSTVEMSSKTEYMCMLLIQIARHMQENGTLEKEMPLEAFVLSEEHIATFAARIANFNCRWRKIIEYLVQGKDRPEIALIIGRPVRSVTITTIKMGLALKIPTRFMLSGSKADLITTILIAAAKHPSSKIMTE
ncbi:MAG: hypothetical protein JWM39_34 [Parcubacteria group bacterium]|nr:hypothetical protein [Parcubacteria group bacterium]